MDKVLIYTPEFHLLGQYQEYVVDFENETSIYYIAQSIPLSDAKAKKRQEIQKELESRLGSGFTYNDIDFYSDSMTMQLLSGAVSVLTSKATRGIDIVNLPNYFWKDKSGSIRQLTTAQIREMGDAFESFVKSIYDESASLLTAVNSAQSIQDLESIQWSAI